MKKYLMFLFALVALGASGCKKCGYCDFGPNSGPTKSVCKDPALVPGIADRYDVEESNCKASQGRWVRTK